MKELHNVDLKNFTTIHIGGIAKTMIVPENADELRKIICDLTPENAIGGGE